MLNVIKMELYRMFRTKSLYVIWFILAAGILFTTSLVEDEMSFYTAEERQEQYEYATGEKSGEQVNIGLSVTAPTKPGEDVSVFDLFYANISGKFIVLFMAIFTVLYSSADMSSGYIKNVAGQLRDRGSLVLAKAANLFVYVVLTLLIFAGIQAISNAIFFDRFVWGEWKEFLAYGGVQTVLHFAFVMIVMCLTIVFRSQVFSMVTAICMCMNVLIIFYSFIDKVIADMGIKGFRILDYTVGGKMMALPMKMTAQAAGSSCAVGAVFAAVTVWIGYIVFRKRDI